jgi:hypothetical protein
MNIQDIKLCDIIKHTSGKHVCSKTGYMFTPLDGTYIQLRLLPQCLVRDGQKTHGATLHCDALNLHTQ